MQDVAAAARVSPDTVYVSLGGKKGLLEGVWATAVTGPNDPDGRDQRDRVAAIASRRDPRDRMEGLVALSCETLDRVSPVHAVLRGAADGHPFAADLQARMLRSRLDTQSRNLRPSWVRSPCDPGWRSTTPPSTTAPCSAPSCSTCSLSSADGIPTATASGYGKPCAASSSHDARRRGSVVAASVCGMQGAGA